MKVKERENQEVQIQKAKRQKAISDAVKTKEQKIRAARETPRIQNGQEMSEGGSLSIKRQNQKSKAEDNRKAECHPPETAGNHPDQGKATETVGAEDHTAAYY